MAHLVRKVACIKRNLVAHTAELSAAYSEPGMILKIQAGCYDCLNYVRTLACHTHFIQLGTSAADGIGQDKASTCCSFSNG